MKDNTIKPKRDSANNQPVNENIRFDKMQVISFDGNNLGILSRDEAIGLAKSRNLDLVLIAPSGGEGVPVTKIMDFGKVQYAKKKQAAEAKKSQKTIQIKEVKIRPKIGEHDYQTKIHQAIDFLTTGKHVKITLMFRGREVAMKEERGKELFDKVDASFAQAGLTKIVAEKDSKSTHLWSRVYLLKK